MQIILSSAFQATVLTLLFPKASWLFSWMKAIAKALNLVAPPVVCNFVPSMCALITGSVTLSGLLLLFTSIYMCVCVYGLYMCVYTLIFVILRAAHFPVPGVPVQNLNWMTRAGCSQQPNSDPDSSQNQNQGAFCSAAYR